MSHPCSNPHLHCLLSACVFKVTHLVIKRPPFFHFKPGDYVFINIPAIAKYEWHPFTISSAPEQQGKTNRKYTVMLVLRYCDVLP